LLTSVKNSPAFSAAYFFKGTQTQKRQFVNFVREEIDNPKIDVKGWDLSSRYLLLLTGDDSQIVKSLQEARNFLKKIPYLNASKFYSKKAANLRKDIIEFDVHRESYDKTRRVKYNGFTFYKASTFLSNGKKYPGYLSKVDFHKKVSLPQAMDFLTEVPAFIVANSDLSNHNFDKLKRAILHVPVLANTQTTGVLGAGNHSIVFALSDKKALKLSFRPCYPKEPKPFDAFIYERGCYKVGDKKLYYCVSKRGENNNEIRIKCSDVDKVSQKIVDAGYQKDDISSLHFCQVVKIDNDYFLCDYDCAKEKGHKSRLYLSP